MDHDDTISCNDDNDDYEWIEHSPPRSTSPKKSRNKSALHSCPKCGSVIPTKRLLNGHLLKCNGESHPCPYVNCPRKFHNANGLSIHVTGAHKLPEDKIDKNILRCPKCDKIYVTNKHFRNYHERPPGFKKKWIKPNKSGRKKIGDSEKVLKFICENCGAKFVKNKSLKRHQLFDLECQILRNGSTVDCEKCGK